MQYRCLVLNGRGLKYSNFQILATESSNIEVWYAICKVTTLKHGGVTFAPPPPPPVYHVMVHLILYFFRNLKQVEVSSIGHMRAQVSATK